jgi:ankyrin repeat protein
MRFFSLSKPIFRTIIGYEATLMPVQPTNTTLSTDLVREFVIAGHGNLDNVRKMLAEHPELLNEAYAWSEKDHETAIQGAAQVGNAPIAEFLLQKGAPLEICTAAMLGRKEELERRIRENPYNIESTGAHGIPILPHSAWSGNLELVQYLFRNGAKAGSSSALHNAITRGYQDLVVWLVENASPDLNSKNFQGKTPLAVAIERKHASIAQLLRDRGANE